MTREYQIAILMYPLWVNNLGRGQGVRGVRKFKGGKIGQEVSVEARPVRRSEGSGQRGQEGKDWPGQVRGVRSEGSGQRGQEGKERPGQSEGSNSIR